MLMHQRFVPGLAIASYIVGDEKSGEAVVIDPTRDVDDFLRFAKDNDLHIRHLVETHVHADFVCGSRELKDRLDGVPQIHCSGHGGEDWTQPYADRHVREGDAIEFGSVRLGFRHTPGHTPEHIAVTLFDSSRSGSDPWVMFTGDFLFVGDVGRPDLLGDEEKQRLAHELYESVFERLDAVPDFTEIHPAHGAGSLCGKAIGSRRSSTLGYERRHNDSLRKRAEAEWVRDLLDDMPLSPPYFKRMKRVNRDGPAVLGREPRGRRRFSAKEVRERTCGDCLILDVRPKEAFAASHIPDSINIPLGDSLPTWAGWVLPYDRPILIVADDPADVGGVVTDLLRVGFDDVEGYLEGGINPWQTGGHPLSRLETMSVHDLDRRRGEFAVLDVRTDREWRFGHIEDANHVHGGTLQDRVGGIPRDRPVAVVCGSGYRASIAASFLKRAGFAEVANVLGGMSAWTAAGLRTV